MAGLLAGFFTCVRAQEQEPLVSYKVLCLLVQFQDVSFTEEEPAAYFQALLNEEGFSEGGARGSVRDYFRDNSGGRFVPEFDVLGPVTLSEKLQYYGKNVYQAGVRIGDSAAEDILPEALALLPEPPEVSLYDALYFIYAGFDESEGGPHDAVWAHQGKLPELGNYACSAELTGGSGSMLSGIGPVCHEMGHLLGLPDLYDTDGATRGHAAGPMFYSLMGTGAHNCHDRRPPCLTALELYLLGWMEEPEELPDGLVELLPVENHTAYRLSASTEGEFYLLECRSGRGWDEGLSRGLVLYHLDRSDLDRWNNWRVLNNLNSTAAHPCFYPIRSSAPGESLKADASLVPGHLVFPGLTRNTLYEPLDWKGNPLGVQLTNMEWNGEKMSLYVIRSSEPCINGRVKDSAGNPLQGAVITLEGGEGYAVSDADGFFSLPLTSGFSSYSLTVTMAGCRPVHKTVSDMHSVSIVLRKEGEADESLLSKFDRHSRFGYYSKPGLGAVRYTPAELGPYAGRILKEITFYPYLEPSFDGNLYVTVDIGGVRVLMKKVENPVIGHYEENKVDVSEAGIVIREGVGMYVGTGSDSEEGYYLGTVYPAPAGNSYWSPFSGEAPSAWSAIYVDKAGYYMDVALEIEMKERSGLEDPADFGYAYIKDPGKGNYSEGEILPLEVAGAPDAHVSWKMDSKALDADKVALTEGTHTLQAFLEYSDGRHEKLSLRLFVK